MPTRSATFATSPTRLPPGGRPNGELILAFRRAPDRRSLGEKHVSHTDANSYLVLVRSHDDGKTWSREPELMYAHPFGGSQDPCLIQLRDGTLVCSSYGWALLNPENAARLADSLKQGNFAFLGGYVLNSKDAGHSWQGPFYPPHVGGDATPDAFGEPIHAYNRGAMCQGNDGRLYWVVAANSGKRRRCCSGDSPRCSVSVAARRKRSVRGKPAAVI